jgi:hypothetical protein
LLGGGSLPEREWVHANGHKQKQVKGASKKMRFDVGISLFFHFYLIPCHLRGPAAYRGKALTSDLSAFSSLPS